LEHWRAADVDMMSSAINEKMAMHRCTDNYVPSAKTCAKISFMPDRATMHLIASTCVILVCHPQRSCTI